jgi:hypothetical protein
MGIDQEGQGFLIETIDCRDRSRIVTLNCGEIIIKKRKLKLSLPDVLKELQSKLLSLSSNELHLYYEQMSQKKEYNT